MDFVILADHRVKLKESENKDKYLDLPREPKRLEHEGDNDSNCNCCARYNLQRISKETGRRGNNRACGDHPEYSIIKIGLNTKKSPGDLRRLAVTQTPVKKTIN